MIEQIISDIETAEDADKDKDVPATPLAAFWAEHRLLHKQDALREFLGTETIEDLDDVHPGDLHTMRAVQWAQATLSIAEANRLARAVRAYHAARPPPPEYGLQWFPAHGMLPGGCVEGDMGLQPCARTTCSDAAHGRYAEGMLGI